MLLREGRYLVAWLVVCPNACLVTRCLVGAVLQQ